MGIFSSKQVCYLCPDKDTNHSTSEHVCIICKDIGKHAAYHHINCRFCTDKNHTSFEHRCTECGKLGHSNKQHLCTYCDEPHISCEHICTICDEKGHQKKVKDHDLCHLCYGKKQYSHHTNNHIDAVGLKNVDGDLLNKFKICHQCNNTVYTIDDKCFNCKSNIKKILICKHCDEKFENRYIKYCAYCGHSLTNIYNDEYKLYGKTPLI